MNYGEYIWQSPHWPDWHYDLAALAEPLAAVSRAQGLLLGRLADVGVALRDESSLAALTEDIVDMILDATSKAMAPFTTERLFDWHAALFPTGYSGISSIKVGHWRDDSTGPMQVISGSIGREKVHFEASHGLITHHQESPPSFVLA